MKELSNVSRGENFKYQKGPDMQYTWRERMPVESICKLSMVNSLSWKTPWQKSQTWKANRNEQKSQKLWENYKQMQSRNSQRKRKRNRQWLKIFPKLMSAPKSYTQAQRRKDLGGACPWENPALGKLRQKNQGQPGLHREWLSVSKTIKNRWQLGI